MIKVLTIILINVFCLSVEVSLSQVNLRRVFINKKYGFINETGKIIVQPSFDYVSEKFGDGLAYFMKGDTNGYIDISGKTRFISKFAKYSFNEGLAPFFVEDKLGFFNTKGEVAFYPKYEDYILGSEMVSQGIPYYSEDLASILIRKCDTCGWFNFIYIDKNGDNAFVDKSFSIAGNFSSGLAYVKENAGRNGYINHDGDFVILLRNNEYGEKFSEGFAVVIDSSNNFYYIDTEGKKLGNYSFENATAFSNGMAKVKINGKWGFIDTSGKLAICPIYNENTCSFSDDLASVSITVNECITKEINHSISFFIDKKGNIILGPFQNSVLQGFHNGLALLIMEKFKNDKSCTDYSYINKQGKVIFQMSNCN